MTGFPPISPQLKKGYILSINQGKETRIWFQYNPDTLTRRLTAQATSSGGGTPARGEALRLKGPPDETISLEIEIDATDQLARGEQTTLQMGIYPALAALEILLYPQSSKVEENERLATSGGVIEIIPFEAPLTLLNWGENRVVPVRITSFSITEEAFDPKLNPIRAKISLEMQVLTYYDLGFKHRGGEAFMAYHKNKEQWAEKNKSVNRGT